METRIIQPSALTRHEIGMMGKQIRRQSRSYQDHKRMKQRHNGRNFHFACLHLLSEEFRCTSYHQSTDKHGYNYKCIIVHPTYPDTTEPGINLHIQHLHHTTERHRRVVHTIHRTIGSDGGRNAPQGCCSRTKPHFLSLHRSAILRNTQFVNTRVTVHLLINIDTDTRQIGKEHYTEYTISQFLTIGIETECENHGHRYNKDRPTFHHIGQIRRILQRMRRVYTEITATIGTQLFNRHNGCRRSLRNQLFLPFQRGHLHLAIESHWSALKNQDKAHNQGKRQQDTCTAQYKEVPEVTYCLRCLCTDGLHDTCHSRHTRCRRNKLEQHDDEQLRKVSQSAFTGIML